jgi:hypothetical protein
MTPQQEQAILAEISATEGKGQHKMMAAYYLLFGKNEGRARYSAFCISKRGWIHHLVFFVNQDRWANMAHRNEALCPWCQTQGDVTGIRAIMEPEIFDIDTHQIVFYVETWAYRFDERK